jgi:hypothetical protein
MFFYAEGVPGSEKISMVRIFPQGNEPVQPGIVYLGTGAVTKTGDGTDSPEQALKVLEESASVEEREKAIETWRLSRTMPRSRRWQKPSQIRRRRFELRRLKLWRHYKLAPRSRLCCEV